jgi:hypothetical protein
VEKLELGLAGYNLPFLEIDAACPSKTVIRIAEGRARHAFCTFLTAKVVTVRRHKVPPIRKACDTVVGLGERDSVSPIGTTDRDHHPLRPGGS